MLTCPICGKTVKRYLQLHTRLVHPPEVPPATMPISVGMQVKMTRDTMLGHGKGMIPKNTVVTIAGVSQGMVRINWRGKTTWIPVASVTA